MVKVIIFDFFGVIHVATYPRWLNKHGFKKEGEFARLADRVDKGTITIQEFFNALHELSGKKVESIRHDFYEDKLIDEALVGLIKSLKSSYKIGLLSNANRGYLRPLLEGHGIADLFDEIIVSSEVKVIKPDPEIFEIALRKMDLTSEEAIFIDDNRRNTDAAASIGIKSILYKDLITLKKELTETGVRI